MSQMSKDSVRNTGWPLCPGQKYRMTSYRLRDLHPYRDLINKNGCTAVWVDQNESAESTVVLSLLSNNAKGEALWLSYQVHGDSRLSQEKDAAPTLDALPVSWDSSHGAFRSSTRQTREACLPTTVIRAVSYCWLLMAFRQVFKVPLLINSASPLYLCHVL